MKTIAYIIGFRFEKKRYENLILTLTWLIEIKKILCLKNNIKLRIIIIEQDAIQQLIIPNDIKSYVQSLFIYNNGYYNRGWAFNVGYLHFFADYYFFGDCDIIMKNDNVLDVFNTCFKYEAVNPYKSIYDSTEEYIENNFNPLNWANPEIFCKRNNICFAGGIVGIADKAMKIISGWDERFRGRGWEDYAFTAKINLFLYSVKTYCYKALHLWHPYELNTTKTINEQLNDEYCNYDFYNYVNLVEKNTIGYSIKYSTLHLLEYKSCNKLSCARYEYAKRKYNCLKSKYKTKKKIYLKLCEQQHQSNNIEESGNSCDTISSHTHYSCVTKSETFGF